MNSDIYSIKSLLKKIKKTVRLNSVKRICHGDQTGLLVFDQIARSFIGGHIAPYPPGITTKNFFIDCSTDLRRNFLVIKQYKIFYIGAIKIFLACFYQITVH